MHFNLKEVSTVLVGIVASLALCAGNASADPALHALLPQSVRDSGVIRLATDAQYPTCNYTDATGKIVGFGPDIWNGLAKKLGVRVDTTSIGFASLIPGVQGDRFDMASECMSDRLEREKVVTFIDYMTAAGNVYALQDDPRITADPLSLCGLKGSAESGTTFVSNIKNYINPNCVRDGKPEATVQEYNSADAALLALYSGRVDFNSNDPTTFAVLEKTAPKPLKSFSYDVFKRDHVGFIVSKGNDQFANALLEAVKAMYSDGEMQSIASKWHIEEFMKLAPGINLAASTPLQ